MNSILKPELLWIEGRCYRVNDPNTELTMYQEHDLYENDEAFEDRGDEGDNDDFEVTMVDDSRYSTKLHVSKHYIGSIIGKKGANKMRIERDTKTEIKIPRQGQPGDIVILGPSPSHVKAARRRLNIIVISSRMKQRATHFPSLPMTSSEIMNNFIKFKEIVLRECPGRGLDESVFIKPEKLHVTFGVMCLMDNVERLQASKLLEEAKHSVIKPILEGHMPLKIRLRGLSYMNDDPREINVLYGKVEEENATPGLLQNVADSLVNHFYKAGFMDHEYGDNIKLHVTLINSKYRSRASCTSLADSEENSERRGRRARESFDGSTILDKYSDFDFGVAEVTDIHLSQRHATDEKGYYLPTCVISLC